ncbi:hypothetical protein D3C79_1029220 [compost metagenome]
MQQVGEEQLGRQLREFRLTRLKFLQQRILLRSVQLCKGFTGGFLAVGIRVADTQVVNLFRHQRQLVTHLFRHIRVERPLHVPD